MPTVPDVVAWTVKSLGAGGSLLWRNQGDGAISRAIDTGLRQPLVLFDALVVCRRDENDDASRGVVGRGRRPGNERALVAWQVIRTRYGDDVDPQAISGLASTMPRYAVLFSLLALAAMGLPPFGVFAGFMGLLLTSPLTSPSARSSCSSPGWPRRGTSSRWCNSCSSASSDRISVLRSSPSEFASLLIVVLVLSRWACCRPACSRPIRPRRRPAPSRDRSHGTSRPRRSTSNPDGWSCEGLSISQAKSSPNTGRCGPSCTTTRSIVWNTSRLKKPSGAANSSWAATAISPVSVSQLSQMRAGFTPRISMRLEAAGAGQTRGHRIAQSHAR